MGDLMDEAERTIRRLRVDAREQQEEAEAVVAELAKASRSLRDAVLDHATAGHAIRVDVGPVSFAGRIVHVGADLVRLVAADRPPVDVVLSGVSGLRSAASDQARATVSTGYPDTLLARCRELVQANARVEIGRNGATAVRGSLLAATASHLEVGDDVGGTWFIPVDSAAWVGRIGDGDSASR